MAEVERRYAIAISPAMQALIERPDDPIGLQFIPDPAELATAPHERADPIADDALSPIKGVVHRYPDRALLKPLLICPVYCRFCFRREHVGPDGGLLSEAELQAAYDWFAARPAIREVILTGGDPFMLSPRRLAAIIAALSAIPHIEILRIHTRVPVADPARLTTALAAALETPNPCGGAARQPRPRVHRRCPCRDPSHSGACDPGARSVRVAAWGERQCCGASRRCSAPCSAPA